MSSKDDLKSLEAKTQAPRDFSGSLEQCSEQLRDAYMNFKDLRSRCVIDVKPSQLGHPDDPTVYYFKPQTFLLDEPEKQRWHRDRLLKRVSQVPKPESVSYLGDELHRAFCQSVADRTDPKQVKQVLLEFFRRRQYNLQHMKYKLLCRWAHHNMTSEAIDGISTEATFIYGKLDYNLDSAIQRC